MRKHGVNEKMCIFALFSGNKQILHYKTSVGVQLWSVLPCIIISLNFTMGCSLDSAEIHCQKWSKLWMDKLWKSSQITAKVHTGKDAYTPKKCFATLLWSHYRRSCPWNIIFSNFIWHFHRQNLCVKKRLDFHPIYDCVRLWSHYRYIRVDLDLQEHIKTKFQD